MDAGRKPGSGAASLEQRGVKVEPGTSGLATDGEEASQTMERLVEGLRKLERDRQVLMTRWPIKDETFSEEQLLWGETRRLQIVKMLKMEKELAVARAMRDERTTDVWKRCEEQGIEEEKVVETRRAAARIAVDEEVAVAMPWPTAVKPMETQLSEQISSWSKEFAEGVIARIRAEREERRGVLSCRSR